MAIRQGGVTVIDDSRNIVNANSINGAIISAGDFGYVRKNAAGSLVWTLNNPNAYSTPDSDSFGQKVVIVKNYAVVAATNEDDPQGTFSGKVYVYSVTTGQLLYTLNNPNAYGTTQDDRFAISGLAATDKYIMASSQFENSFAGIAYVFDITNGQFLYTLTHPAGSSSFSEGGVAAFGRYGTVSARFFPAAGTGSGTVYVYDLSNGKLVYTLNNPNAYSTIDSDDFGISVAISDKHIIVGADQEADAGGTNSGKAYIFNIATGSLLWTLDNPNAYSTSANDAFGRSVGISGNYAIVSASTEDDAGGTGSGKAYIFNVTTGALVWTLNNPNVDSTSQDDYFGTSVAISGNYAIVGAYGESGVGGKNSGVTYVYNVVTGQRILTLYNPNPVGTGWNDFFSQSLSISGNYAIIGARGEDEATAGDSGKAYIFSINDTYRLTNVEEVQLTNGMKISADNKLLQQSVPAGALIHRLDNPNAYSTSAGDVFASSVAISGNYAIVGAVNEDDAGGTDSGKVYVFNVVTGALIYTIDDPNAYGGTTFDYFGVNIAISGNYVIIGAYAESDAAGSFSGKAYIYNTATRQLISTLTNPNAYSTSASDYFGISVAISGNYAIVAAPYEDDAGGTSSGKAYIFNVTTGALLWALNNPNAYSTSQDDYFGQSVAISGSYAIVGAWQEDDVSGANSGIAYVYDVFTGTLLYTLNNPSAQGTRAGDYFGWASAMEGRYTIVSAPYEHEVSAFYSGKVYVFDTATGSLIWTLSNPNTYSTSSNDNFGTSVAISGNYAIIAAKDEDDAGGTSSGKAYIFNVTTGALLWALDNPNAYSTSSGDNFGYSVAISGEYAIVGAQNEDDPSGTSSGKAYIFSVRDLTYLDRLVQMVS